MTKPTTAKGSKSADPEQQLKSFIAKFEPKRQALIRSSRRKLRERFPTAYELVYDNYNFFVIGYGPTERPSDAVLSIVAAANGIGLCFIRGASLEDPKKLLLGSGKQTRYIRVPSTDVLDRPEVRALIDAAEAKSKTVFPSGSKGRLVIRSVSKAQRPRRKPRK